MTKKQTKTIESLKSFLLKKPGYLKCSKQEIRSASYIHNASDEEIKIAIKESKTPIVVIQKTKTPVVSKNPYDKKNTLIIGDTHEPFTKDGYIDFCIDLQKQYNCGTIIHIGDLVDNHAVSYHDHDPDGRSPGDEYKLALERCEQWYKAFPNVKICIGNHDRLPFRKAFTAGLPKNWLKSYQEMFNSPNTWEWDFVHKINNVIFQHGTGLSGEMASINAARENRYSTAIGHLHTVCNIRFLASSKDLIFGQSVGCGIDHAKYAFAYGRENTRKPVIAAGLILNNGSLPINIPMPI
jgi:predicted phosphodiesterase